MNRGPFDSSDERLDWDRWRGELAAPNHYCFARHFLIPAYVRKLANAIPQHDPHKPLSRNESVGLKHWRRFCYPQQVARYSILQRGGVMKILAFL